MDSAQPYIAFAWLALAMTLAPGADTIFVLRASLRDGWRSGVAATFGVVCGVVLWGALAGLGVAVLLSRFPSVYDTIAAAGGLYLVFLAVCTFSSAWHTWRVQAGSEVDVDGAGPHHTMGRTFGGGLATNLLNPKIGVFYLSVMPGLFVGQALSLWVGLSLGGIHAALGLAWMSILSVAASWARRYLLRPGARAVMDGLCGLLLAVFGMYVIVEVAVHLAA